MFAVTLILSLVAAQGTISLAKTSRKELMLSKFQSDLGSLNLDVGLLKLDADEIRDIIAGFNDTVIASKQENGSSTENVRNDSKVEENTNENKINLLIKAFREENLFYHNIVRERKEFKAKLLRELHTAVEFLTDTQTNNTRDLLAKIKDLEQKLEECAANRKDISMLESEIIVAKNESDTEIREREGEFNTLNTKLEQLIRNTSENFVTEDEFNEEQHKQIERQDLEKMVSQCDGSWVLNYQLKTCFLFVTKVKNWDDATRFCENHGGRMLQIENAEKKEHIKHMYEESGKRWGKGWVGFWAGSSDSNSEGSWEWNDDEQAFNYTQWDKAFTSGTEPNGGTAENCLAVLLMNSWNYFKWNDADCEDEMPFICEKVVSV